LSFSSLLTASLQVSFVPAARVSVKFGATRRTYACPGVSRNRDYLILEAVASKIMVYESHRVPVLLQTAQYASAVVDTGTVMPAAMRDRSVQAALARQQAVLAGERPELAVVIGEAALRQNVGGDEGMRTQLGRIATIGAGIPKVTILPELRIALANFGPGMVTGGAERWESVMRWDTTISVLREWKPHIVLCQEISAGAPGGLRTQLWLTANTVGFPAGRSRCAHTVWTCPGARA
jgi:Domain of unknown function (DUF5753)